MTSKNPNLKPCSQHSTQAQTKLEQLKNFFEEGTASKKEKYQGAKKFKPSQPTSNASHTKREAVNSDKRAQIQARQDRIRKVNAAVDWLCASFPNCFSKDAPSPLKLQIEKDVLAYFHEDLPFTRTHTRHAIARYTNTDKYLASFLTHAHRHDLNGIPVEEILASHKEYALYKQQNRSQSSSNKKQETADGSK